MQPVYLSIQQKATGERISKEKWIYRERYSEIYGI